MQIRVAFLPECAGEVSEAVCIVVDALRATTVIATLFARGCPRVYVAASHEAARQFARARGVLLCGETGGLKVPDFDHGNSPVEFAALDFTGKPVTLSTTNGTKALAVVSGARQALIGAAVNRLAVAQAAWEAARETGSDICIVCAGTEKAFTLEDATVAGILVEAIAARAGAWEMPEQADSAVAARRLWQSEPNLLRGWMECRHALKLADSGLGDDLAYCAALDTVPIAPVLVTENEAGSVSAPVLLVPEN